MKNFLIVGIILIIVILSALITKNIKIDDKISEITPKEAMILLKNPNYIVLDVRERDEYNSGHLENAINIPMSELKNKFRSLPSDKTIIINCYSGKRSLLALNFLKDQGYDNLINLKGGIMAWINEGYPVKNN